MKNLENSIFYISGEVVEGCGEDALITDKYNDFSVIGVFDGCGGIGSRKYKEHGNKSGACVASNTAKNATQCWFDSVVAVSEITDKLEEYIKNNLNNLISNETKIKGDLSKEFPTTVSVIAVKEDKNTAKACFMWAGDSRGYILEKSGLVQITRDDIVGGADAYTNLTEDARLSNFAYSNGDFRMNTRWAELDEPCVLITATDGCFGYFKTPMEFENMLIETLMMSGTIDEWKLLIYEKLVSVSGDDFSICLSVLGFSKFEKLKKTMKKRYKYLNKVYISKLKNDRISQRLWEEYKEDYYA